MNDFDVVTIPIFSRMGTLFVWVMLLNVLLAGAVIFLAFRARALSQRIRDLEQAMQRMTSSAGAEHSKDDNAADRIEP